MDGLHDLGGRQGFGPVRYTLDAPAFHARWEVQVNALYGHVVRRGVFNMDEYRHAIERMDARHYVAAGYYERTLTSLATLCVEKGLFTREELERQAGGAVPLARPSAPGRGNAVDRQTFRIGDRVQVRDEGVPGHIRLPAYIRGHVGTVVGVSPAYPFPDAHAHGIDAADEPTYDVRFASRDLWPEASDEASVHVGVFESYLRAAP
jgi:nitrile hydratase subunit beta